MTEWMPSHAIASDPRTLAAGAPRRIREEHGDAGVVLCRRRRSADRRPRGRRRAARALRPAGWSAGRPDGSRTEASRSLPRSCRLREDELAVLGEEDGLLGAHSDGIQSRQQAQLGQLANRVRQEVDADAKRLEFRHRFVDAAGDSGLMQAERQGQSADAGAQDDDVFVCLLMAVSSLPLELGLPGRIMIGPGRSY